MKQFMDIFSLPEMTLLCCVNDYFMKHNIDYEPVHLYKDVKVRGGPAAARQTAGVGTFVRLDRFNSQISCIVLFRD